MPVVEIRHNHSSFILFCTLNARHQQVNHARVVHIIHSSTHHVVHKMPRWTSWDLHAFLCVLRTQKTCTDQKYPISDVIHWQARVIKVTTTHTFILVETDAANVSTASPQDLHLHKENHSDIKRNSILPEPGNHLDNRRLVTQNHIEAPKRTCLAGSQIMQHLVRGPSRYDYLPSAYGSDILNNGFCSSGATFQSDSRSRSLTLERMGLCPVVDSIAVRSKNASNQMLHEVAIIKILPL